jgi:hypothetical protein
MTRTVIGAGVLMLSLFGCSEDSKTSKDDDTTPSKEAGSPTSEGPDAAVDPDPGASDSGALDSGASDSGPGADELEYLPDGAVVLHEECLIEDPSDAPDFVEQVGCTEDYMALASQPPDSELPGIYSVKVVLDTYDNDHLYFQNSQRYQIHYEFVSEHLSGGDFAVVPGLQSFNSTEYYVPEDERRFFLAAVSYYEAADAWALEFAPYDTATASIVERVFNAVKSHAFFGPKLTFHPTSTNIANRVLPELSDDVSTISDEEIYVSDYQPLTLGTALGRLHMTLASNLGGENPEYLAREDIVVLDAVPNDISVVAGLITQEFQTPLSHVNVLAQNRKTPNMGLRGAMTNEKLLAFDGKWVRLTVGGNDWTIEEVTEEEALAYIEDKRPEPIELPPLDLETTELADIEDITIPEGEETLREAIKRSVLAYGGKAAQYSVLAQIGDKVPVRKAFAIPVYYYDQFMRENGLYDEMVDLLADPEFQGSPDVRDAALEAFRDKMKASPVNQEFQDLLKAKMDEVIPGLSIRFRTSTNSEDLEGFPCAGCYESQTGDPNDPAEGWEDVLKALRKTWASIWLFRTFEERSYYGIDHNSVGMALLCHHNFPDEEANGVAVTANPFDAAGLEPAFYVNVQKGGEAEVVHPPAGVASDQFLYYFDNPNRPITYIAHSSLIEEGQTVLNAEQTLELGFAMQAIHAKFSEAYGPKAGNQGWYAMDIEFKFDDEDDPENPARLLVKQARPYPGRGAMVVDQEK